MKYILNSNNIYNKYSRYSSWNTIDFLRQDYFNDIIDNEPIAVPEVVNAEDQGQVVDNVQQDRVTILQNSEGVNSQAILQ